MADDLYDRVLDALKRLLREDISKDSLNDGSDTDDSIQAARYEAENCIWTWTERPGESDSIKATKSFTNAVIGYVDELSAKKWIGCVPIEMRFCGFPAASEFGPFRIINPLHSQRADQNDDWDEIKWILKTKYGLQTPPAIETSSPGQTERVLKCAVLNRPQLVFELGSGEDVHCTMNKKSFEAFICGVSDT